MDNVETAQVGEGNDIATTYTTANCQVGCNVEDCGYDIGSLADQGTWDCCSADCITSLATATECDATCNEGECNFYRAAGTDIGLCCDETGPDGVVGGGDDIDCATLAGNGSCDEACNTGACNNDGGDCE